MPVASLALQPLQRTASWFPAGWWPPPLLQPVASASLSSSPFPPPSATCGHRRHPHLGVEGTDQIAALTGDLVEER